MENMSDREIKRSLAFDAYGRHAIVKEIINANRKGVEKCRILDVGAGQYNFLRLFLPDDDVYSLDPYIDADGINRIEGDGCDIPLADNSFDYVVSSDVFEHIKPSRRAAFLKENLRVARLAVILAAPFYSKETELAELYANENYRILSKGENHIWLQEHIKNGLPQENEVEDFLKKEGFGFQKIPNNNLWLWENLVFSTFIDHGKTVDKLWDFNLFYNEKVFPFDHEENSYRKIYFIKKNKDLEDLKLPEGKIDSSLYLEAIKNNLSLFCHVYVQYRDQIAQLEKLNHQMQKELEQTARDLGQAIELSERIYSSRSWRITRPLREIRPAAHKLVQLAKKFQNISSWSRQH